jgi:hypothetical protein
MSSGRSAWPEPERVLERSPILRIVEPANDGSPEELIRALEAQGSATSGS